MTRSTVGIIKGSSAKTRRKESPSGHSGELYDKLVATKGTAVYLGSGKDISNVIERLRDHWNMNIIHVARGTYIYRGDW